MMNEILSEVQPHWETYHSVLLLRTSGFAALLCHLLLHARVENLRSRFHYSFLFNAPV